MVALAQHTPTAKALVRYVEAKALVGGVTTGQGMRMKEQGVTKHFVGAMRNVETTDDPRLPEAATRVPDINPNRREDVDSFRRNLDRATAFFYHMSEGTDDAARRHFLNLKDNDLLGAALVGIHALGLQRADLDDLAAKGGKVVWSPLSNLLLYGATVKLKDLLESGVNFSLGCDWSPSGSKNPLLELKVARWVAQQQGAALTARDLVGLVSDKAAGVVGWAKQLGSLAGGKLADVLAIAGEQGDPFEHLINARERQVQLVIVHGMPRYGDETLMQALQPGPATQLESVMIDGAAKRFFLQHPLSTLNDLSFNTARDRLQDAMNDLKSFVQQTSGLLAVPATQDSFRLVLDMEDEHDGDASGFADAALLAVDPNDVAKQRSARSRRRERFDLLEYDVYRAQSPRRPGSCGATLLFLTTWDPSRFRPRRSGIGTASLVSNNTSRSAGVSRSDASYSLLNWIAFLVGVSLPTSVVSFITISPGLTVRTLSTRLSRKCGLCVMPIILMSIDFQAKS